MELFDKKFVYLEWDDELKGKKVLAGDNLQLMRMEVNDGTARLRHVEDNSSNSDLYPFNDDCGTLWALVYYDPNYSCKLAYSQGKKIQFKSHYGSKEWSDCDDPAWSETYEYREKPASEMWTAVFNDEGVISVIHASDWNKSKGRQLIEGTEEECRGYAVENYCKRCVHEVSICCSPRLGCQGFRELKSELQPTDKQVCITCIHRCSLSEPNEYCKSCWHVDGLPMWKLDESAKVCGTCKYKDLPYSCIPCRECMEGDVDSDERSMWEPIEVKKRRMTNRELAKWLAQGNGECLHNTIAFTVWDYLTESKDKTVMDGVKIRGWDETEWHEPEVEE